MEEIQLGRERPVAVVTGASSGLGSEFARQLAAAGYDLLLTARRNELLESLRREIVETRPVIVEIFPCDLTDTEELARLEARLGTVERFEFLVNNAGFGTRSCFPDVDLRQFEAMQQLHCTVPLRLAEAALQTMCRQRRGSIVNVASLAGFLFNSGVSQYCATKAYLLSLSRSMQCDVRCYGVKIQALCPGLVHTGFHATESMRQYDKSRSNPFLWLTAEYVVRSSLRALQKRRHRVVCIPSFRYKLIRWLLCNPLLEPIVERSCERRTDDKP